MGQGLYRFCVSTIRNEAKIREFLSEGRGKFTENKAWKTARVLFLESLEIGTRMPLILSDAANNTEKLLCWATLRKVDIDAQSTMVEFDQVKKIRGDRPRRKLTLRSSGKQIKPHYRRNYAICETPPFLK